MILSRERGGKRPGRGGCLGRVGFLPSTLPAPIPAPGDVNARSVAGRHDAGSPGHADALIVHEDFHSVQGRGRLAEGADQEGGHSLAAERRCLVPQHSDGEGKRGWAGGTARESPALARAPSGVFAGRGALDSLGDDASSRGSLPSLFSCLPVVSGALPTPDPRGRAARARRAGKQRAGGGIRPPEGYCLRLKGMECTPAFAKGRREWPTFRKPNSVFWTGKCHHRAGNSFLCHLVLVQCRAPTSVLGNGPVQS